MILCASAATALLAARAAASTSGIRVGRSKWGRGVFATRDYAKGDVIEVCPLVVRPRSDDWYGPVLNDYYFVFNNSKNAIALGYCSLYNHQNNPNCEYSLNKGRPGVYGGQETMTVRANRPIKAGDEIFITYGTAWWATRRRKPEEKKTSK